MNRTLIVAIGVAIALFIPRDAAAAVFLNELTVQGIERVELYNRGPGFVNLTNWQLRGHDGALATGGTYTIPPSPPVPPGVYVVITIPGPGIFPDAGAEGALLDPTGGTADAVFYGQYGSAPLPYGEPPDAALVAPSLARAPDAALAVPPPPDPDLDGLVWTLDFTPTFGAMNDAPQPQMGTSLRLNELDPHQIGIGDRIEIHNPTFGALNPSFWILTNGAQQIQLLPGPSIPPGGLAVYFLSGFELETFGLLYLFRNDGVRVDQLGFWQGPLPGAPTLQPCENWGRYPDGAGPSLGYNFVTSGGGMNFFPLTASLGAPNPLQSCGHSSVEETPRAEPMTWGALRSLYRRR